MRVDMLHRRRWQSSSPVGAGAGVLQLLLVVATMGVANAAHQVATTATRGGSLRYGTLRSEPDTTKGAHGVKMHLTLSFATDVFWGAAAGAPVQVEHSVDT
jgi:hypothetical protein